MKLLKSYKIKSAKDIIEATLPMIPSIAILCYRGVAKQKGDESLLFFIRQVVVFILKFKLISAKKRINR